MKRLLFFIKSWTDLERALVLARSAKDRFECQFVYFGDFNPLYEALDAKDLKKLLSDSGFEMKEVIEFSLVSRLLSRFALVDDPPFKECRFFGSPSIFRKCFNLLLRKYLRLRNPAIISKIFDRLKPDALLTDCSSQFDHYPPELFRREARRRGISIFIYSHGAGPSLQVPFNAHGHDLYPGSFLMANCEHELKGWPKDHAILLGDPRASVPCVELMQKASTTRFNYLDDRPHRIVFFVSCTFPQCGGAWDRMMDMIMAYGNREDVAMVVKRHPREALPPLSDARLIGGLNNALLLEKNVDTSALLRWSTIAVNSDISSTVFECVILGKKVIAFRGKRLPEYEATPSPLEGSSIHYFRDFPRELNLATLKNADPKDPKLSALCWGGHGPVDLGQIAIEFVARTLGSGDAPKPSQTQPKKIRDTHERVVESRA